MSDSNGKLPKTNVADFTQKFKTQKELQEYARAQFLTLLQANKRIEHLETENTHLKSQIEAMKVRSEEKPEIRLQSNEQDLCEIEIKRLKDIALERALTLEETKRMDLLVKNLYLAKGKPTPSGAKGRKTEEPLTDSELIKLATLPDSGKDSS